MSSNILADKDINEQQAPAGQKTDIKSMEYHRQMLQSRLNEDQ
jgi:hypothetical protein